MNKDHLIYLDHNATSFTYPELVSEMSEISCLPLNASSIHGFGRRAYSIIEEAKRNILNALNIQENYGIIFTSTATEANNLALLGAKYDIILTSSIEHSSILNPVKKVDHQLIPVNEDGLINLGQLENLLGESEGKNILVSIMAANSETGVIQPIKEICALAKKYGALIHSDAVQVFGRKHLDLSDLDFITISCHKAGGPKGVGALIYNKDYIFQPIIFGGGQQLGIWPGTENVIAIKALSKLAENYSNYVDNWKKLKDLRDYLESKIEEISKDAKIIGKKQERLDNTSSIYMPGKSSATQVIMFDMHNICISSGSACSSGKMGISSVLTSMNLDDEIARNVIRVSLGWNNVKSDVEFFIETWKKIYNKTN